ncbi:reverse transcriptase domain-containing protein [Trichonephila clavata]|uniref:Reverse transcriptase domain-containing protein n=1 Tax=Trichonephila clavata TaxID=2740835 RepID=A0A8X6FK52_TRICU|nr:reverse transcriptase domain-containing protein [Trichonephila clavata]
MIERVLQTEKPTDRAVFYLPHQSVFRQESLTTKMLIVFDASSHENGQLAHNECIWSGANLNPNIFHLIIYFRLNTIAITADIECAFLQISLRDEDRDAIRFLFPELEPNKTDSYKLQVYRFKHVMFGVKICASSADKIYDPIGFLSPYTIRLKCLLQELWLWKLAWDDEIPPDIYATWSQWWSEVPLLSELKIPRMILNSGGDSCDVQIYTFFDASQKAHGAAAFLRVKYKDRIGVNFVTSKSSEKIIPAQIGTDGCFT